MKYEVVVQLKKEILDPEGRAINSSLGQEGFSGLTGVRVSKRFVLNFKEEEQDHFVAQTQIDRLFQS